MNANLAMCICMCSYLVTMTSKSWSSLLQTHTCWLLNHVITPVTRCELRAFMNHLFFHRWQLAAMLPHIRTHPSKSVRVSRSPPSVGLLSVAAILSLITWYIFSFLTLFMNKYTLDALQAEPFLFCEYHFTSSLPPNFVCRKVSNQLSKEVSN